MGQELRTVQSRNVAISRDEWLKALSEAGYKDGQDDPTAITVAEFAAMVGLNRQTAVRRLHAMVAAGKATRTQKRSQSSDGRTVVMQAFKLAKATTSGKP